MSHEDFDIDSLAAYLHLTPTQVLRLATRDRIPGRRVAGEWRFSQAEIHHWLEERIGASDDEDLQRVEGMLQRQAERTQAQEFTTLRDLLSPESVILPITARSRWSVVDAICQHAMSIGRLWDAEKMGEAIRAREDLHSTALENGVALLHPRRPMSNLMDEPFLILGRTYQGVPFGGPRGQLTDLFFLVASVSDQGHLQTLARLSRLLSVPETLAAFREADEAAEMYQTFCDADAALDSSVDL